MSGALALVDPAGAADAPALAAGAGAVAAAPLAGFAFVAGVTRGAAEFTAATRGLARGTGGFTAEAGGFTAEAGGFTAGAGGFTAEAGGGTGGAGGMAALAGGALSPAAGIAALGAGARAFFFFGVDGEDGFLVGMGIADLSESGRVRPLRTKRGHYFRSSARPFCASAAASAARPCRL